ncbi:probable leucine-rich repeat receptor-like protein kinase At1g35710 [Juglans regia]|uniref:non-specific serine/threonine protein kinase n=2 Tax=Juglans regia TaxID=51240 RepID=A0A2I4HUT5_JUGRE|nr:probable leucine-rich repeat receptor-like protein kinase At1g35710 [Juglans regia]
MTVSETEEKIALSSNWSYRYQCAQRAKAEEADFSIVQKVGFVAYRVALPDYFDGSIVKINITESSLQGTLQGFSFLSFPNLAYIDLYMNALFGSIPPQISYLSELEYLDLSLNKFSSKIPPEIGRLTNLKVLHLRQNNLNGSIPEEIGRLNILTEFVLQNNQIDGFIPSSLGNMSNLVILFLYGNELSGFVPPEMGNLSNLDQLDISHNLLTDPIPPTFGNLKKLTILHMFDNSLTGPIPSELGNLKSLKSVSLQHNNLLGSIPASLGDLGSIPDSNAFLNASIGALQGNKGLCGNVTGLEPCNASMIYKHSSKRGHKVVFLLVCPLLGAVTVLLSIFGFVLFMQRRNTDLESKQSKTEDQVLSLSIVHINGRTLYDKIIKVTNGFDALYYIGKGGHGTIYKVGLTSGDILAVKKFNRPLHDAGENRFQKEFLNEIRALIDIRH